MQTKNWMEFVEIQGSAVLLIFILSISSVKQNRWAKMCILWTVKGNSVTPTSAFMGMKWLNFDEIYVYS